MRKGPSTLADSPVPPPPGRLALGLVMHCGSIFLGKYSPREIPPVTGAMRPVQILSPQVVQSIIMQTAIRGSGHPPGEVKVDEEIF